MTNLQKLEADIRQKLPRLMEAKAGLKLSHGLEIVFDDSDGFCYAYDAETDKVKLYKASDLVADFHVIGHDPRLNDVLEWLGIEYMINGNGALCKWSDDECRYIPQDKCNLSEPLLKNQDQSEINYLAGLI